MDIRGWVLAGLKPALPKGWRLIPYGTDPGAIDRVTVLVWVESINREVNAPNTHRRVAYTLTVIEPKTEPGASDDALDNDLFDLLDALDESPNLTWSNGQRITWADSYPAYSITLEALIKKEI